MNLSSSEDETAGISNCIQALSNSCVPNEEKKKRDSPIEIQHFDVVLAGPKCTRACILRLYFIPSI